MASCPAGRALSPLGRVGMGPGSRTTEQPVPAGARPVTMSSLTSIFHPLLGILADLIAFFYGLVHDYSFAIALLTILVYLVLTPLLVKQTRSMIQMQKLQPELKKLQQKYKGKDIETRQKFQQEMQALYREHGVNPMGGCLPMIIQLPVLFVMYDVIRGLLSVKTRNNHAVLNALGQKIAEPKYISHASSLYHNLVAGHGTMKSLGIDLAQAAGQHHSSFVSGLPYYAIVLGAIGLSVVQMQQMTIRNRKLMEQTPQMKQMQRMQLFTPLIMILFYWKFPVALSIYFIVSSIFRIVQQEMMYRFDPVLVAHVDAAIARQPGAAKKPISPSKPKLNMPSSPPTAPSTGKGSGGGKAPGKVTDPEGGTGKGTESQDTPNKAGANGSEEAVKAHPRSKAKRPRKAR